jgi:hypothetical protein
MNRGLLECSGGVTDVRAGDRLRRMQINLQRMVTLRSMRPISRRAPSLFDYEQPPDARARWNAAGSRNTDPVSWLLFLAALLDEGGSARALPPRAGVLTIADAAISIAEALVKS